MSLKYDEAIEIMNEIKELPYLGSRLMDWVYHNEAVDIAISSIEKQVPKKVLVTRKSCGIPFGKCPLCNKEIDKMKNYFYHEDENCLQKLKWG